MTAFAQTMRDAIAVSKAQGPVTLQAELRFQTISFRWARNLGTYAAAETKRFASYYDSMAQGSSDRTRSGVDGLTAINPIRTLNLIQACRWWKTICIGGRDERAPARTGDRSRSREHLGSGQ
jgi:hypothetical protein